MAFRFFLDCYKNKVNNGKIFGSRDLWFHVPPARSVMSDDSSHHHDAQGHDGKEHVALAAGGTGQTQSLDRALRPASSGVTAATTRQHSLGRNQPHHHHQPGPAGSANQNAARTVPVKEAR